MPTSLLKPVRRKAPRVGSPFALIPSRAGGNPGLEWEVRLYDQNGKRVRLPRGWIEICDFEIGEQGGCLQGTVKLLASWEVLQLTGGERVDIWLWGRLIYRGYVRLPQAEASVPESHTFTTYGLMQTVQGYLVRRNFAYAAETDIGILFRDMVNFYVKRTGRLPGIIIDTLGVFDLNITVQTFDASGRDFAQAMNDLVAISPGSLIWGCDVDPYGQDRIYLRPRTQAVKYKYSVGDKVSAFVYPVDSTQIVNGLFVTGAAAVYPNLAPNASFERCVPPGETSGNLLQSPSFEDASGGTITNWGVLGNPTSYTQARTGNVSVKIDNNPSSPEGVYQEVFVPALPTPVGWSVYARCPAGQVWHLNVKLELKNGSGTVLDSQTFGPYLVPDDELYYRYASSWIAQALGGGVKVRMSIYLSSSDSGGGGPDDGLDIDDAALWFGDVLAEGWEPGRSANATFAVLDWQNRDIPAFDGDIVVKVQPNILSAGGYAQIDTTPDKRISVKTNTTYTFAVYVAGDVLNSPEIALSARGYTGGVEGTHIVESAHHIITSGLWHLIVYSFATGPADSLDLTIRFYNGNAAWIDAVGLWQNNLPDAWYPDQNFVAHKTVSDYAGSISSAAAASITNYGLREKEESNTNVMDQATLDAFCIGYFNAHAVPIVQARLSLFGPTAPLSLDGQVQITNLPSEPPPLFPSRVHYQIGDAITIDADLGNQRPDLALLLQKAARNALI